MGYDFKGIYNIWEKNINLFSGDSKKNIEETIAFDHVEDPELDQIIGAHAAGHSAKTWNSYMVYIRNSIAKLILKENYNLFFSDLL